MIADDASTFTWVAPCDDGDIRLRRGKTQKFSKSVFTHHLRTGQGWPSGEICNREKMKRSPCSFALSPDSQVVYGGSLELSVHLDLVNR